MWSFCEFFKKKIPPCLYIILKNLSVLFVLAGKVLPDNIFIYRGDVFLKRFVKFSGARSDVSSVTV